MSCLRVALVDHQTVFLDAVALALADMPGMEVVLATRSVERLVPVTSALAVEVAVVAVDHRHGVSDLRRLRDAEPRIRCVALHDGATDEELANVLRAGVRGLVRRSDGVDRLVETVRGAANDETHWPPEMLSVALDAVLAEPSPPSADEQLIETLTARERDVLACLIRGYPRSEIARRLYLSPNTVRTHINNLLRKLDVHSCVAAVALARRAGYTPMDEDALVVRLA